MVGGGGTFVVLSAIFVCVLLWFVYSFFGELEIIKFKNSPRITAKILSSSIGALAANATV